VFMKKKLGELEREEEEDIDDDKYKGRIKDL
jgi:hypothetical protein